MGDNRPAAKQQRTRDRRETLIELIEFGENLEGAAKRLGIGTYALEKWCYNHDSKDLLVQLNRERLGAGVKFGFIRGEYGVYYE